MESAASRCFQVPPVPAYSPRGHTLKAAGLMVWNQLSSRTHLKPNMKRFHGVTAMTRRPLTAHPQSLLAIASVI